MDILLRLGEGARPGDGNGLRDLVKAYLGKKIDVSLTSKGAEYRITDQVSSVEIEDYRIKLNIDGFGSMLDEGMKSRVFRNKTIPDVIKEVLDKYENSYRLNLDSCRDNFEYLCQYNESDYHFLRRLVGLCGAFFYETGEELVVTVEPATDTVILDDEDLAAGCSVKVLAAPKSPKTSAVSASYDPHQLFEATIEWPRAEKTPGLLELAKEKAENDSAVTDINNIAINNESLLNSIMENRAAGVVSRIIRYRINVEHPAVQPGTVIRLNEHPYVDSDLFVTSVEIQMEGNNLFSGVAEAIPVEVVSGEYFDNDRPSPSLTPATVTDNKDSRKYGRVEVEFPWDRQNRVWARVVVPAARESGGAAWTPAIGDEVLVGFELGEISRPVVLGSLYNSSTIPSFDTDNGTEEYLLAKTSAGNEVRIIDSPGKEEIRVVMRENKNEIRMNLKDKPEISIRSLDGTFSIEAGRINIKADEEITLEGRSISLKGKESFDARANNIGIKGDSEVDIKSGLIRLN